jgi:hypothetical protein
MSGLAVYQGFSTLTELSSTVAQSSVPRKDDFDSIDKLLNEQKVGK